MSILGLIAAFGGGVFAAAIGAVPAFIMTGIFSSSSPAVSFAFFIIFFLVILFPDEKSMRTPLNPQYQCFLFLLTDSPVL